MGQFLLWSLIGSVVLTVALNLLPALFPDAARRTEERIVRQVETRDTEPGRGRVRVFFPWKAMIAVSLGLTVLLNVAACVAR